MNKKILIPMAILSLAMTPWTNAALTVDSVTGGAPTGVSKVNFDNLSLGTQTGTLAVGPSGSVTVTTTGDASVVIGDVFNEYAAPRLSGLNGDGFGNVYDPLPPGSDDTTPYLQAGSDGGGGSVTLTFAEDQLYFGILWGSVDANPGLPSGINKLEFFNSANVSVGTVTGADVHAAPGNGSQGVAGTAYVEITSTLAFNRVVATSTGKTFEFDNVAYNPTVPGCDPNICVLTQGYWKNKGAQVGWPVQSLMLGTVSYTKPELLSILNTPVRGNGLISLAYQLIAAKLNIARGACVPTDVQSAITTADNLILGLIIPPVGTGKIDPALTSALTNILDAYNNGLAPGGPAHCND